MNNENANLVQNLQIMFSFCTEYTMFTSGDGPPCE